MINNGTSAKCDYVEANRKEIAINFILDAFNGMNVNFLVQEFIEEAGGADIRAFVVGNKVVGAMMRTGAEGDFRSNLHQGGTAIKYKLSKEEKITAQNTTKIKIPNVCENMGVRWMNDFEFIAEVGMRFSCELK